MIGRRRSVRPWGTRPMPACSTTDPEPACSGCCPSSRSPRTVGAAGGSCQRAIRPPVRLVIRGQALAVGRPEPRTRPRRRQYVAPARLRPRRTPTPAPAVRRARTPAPTPHARTGARTRPPRGFCAACTGSTLSGGAGRFPAQLPPGDPCARTALPGRWTAPPGRSPGPHERARCGTRAVMHARAPRATGGMRGNGRDAHHAHPFARRNILHNVPAMVDTQELPVRCRPDALGPGPMPPCPGRCPHVPAGATAGPMPVRRASSTSCFAGSARPAAGASTSTARGRPATKSSLPSSSLRDLTS